MIRSSVLVLPNISKPSVIQTEASCKVIGAVLQQECHPVSYYNKNYDQSYKNHPPMYGNSMPLPQLFSNRDTACEEISS